MLNALSLGEGGAKNVIFEWPMYRKPSCDLIPYGILILARKYFIVKVEVNLLKYK